jgi:hypothetical protein
VEFVFIWLPLGSFSGGNCTIELDGRRTNKRLPSTGDGAESRDKQNYIIGEANVAKAKGIYKIDDRSSERLSFTKRIQVGANRANRKDRPT